MTCGTLIFFTSVSCITTEVLLHDILGTNMLYKTQFRTQRSPLISLKLSPTSKASAFYLLTSSILLATLFINTNKFSETAQMMSAGQTQMPQGVRSAHKIHPPTQEGSHQTSQPLVTSWHEWLQTSQLYSTWSFFSGQIEPSCAARTINFTSAQLVDVQGWNTTVGPSPSFLLRTDPSCL